ncbi:MAG TPA: Bcr/CflA family multidrug efflux MFS transporter [Thiobacillaceae bacterium]|nr:Bcr/CflA family multidrug efflux MFS transporter [Thiobacillaceae bacterium]HNU65246.1 Bcr/CflA family multidrug efflux MFS transporter [Thiobacillaceae bacterium]
MRPGHNRNFTLWVVILGSLTAIGPLSIDMYLPAFPGMEAELGVDPGAVELTLAVFFIGTACGQLFWGPLSDRFGRRPPLYVAMAVFGTASLGCALAESVQALAFWRLLQALGGSAGMVISRAMVRDCCAAREAARVFSLLILVMGLAPILAPLLGGWVSVHLGWRAIFTTLALFALVCLLAVRFGLQESHDIRHEPPLNLARILRDYGGLFGNRAFLGYTLSGGFAMAGMFAYIAGSAFVFIQLGGVSQVDFGWFFGANALGFVLASQVNARILKHFAPTRLLRHALWAPALAGLALAVFTALGQFSLAVILAGIFVYVSSLGFIAPNASACALATHGQQAGAASALMGALQFGLATLTGMGISLLHDGTARPLAFFLAVCGLLALATHRLLVHPHEGRRR